MDPLIGGVLGRAIGSMVIGTAKKMGNARSQAVHSPEIIGDQTLEIEGEIEAIATEGQILQIEEFLKGPEVARLTKSYCIARIACPREVIKIVEEKSALGFASLTEDWCKQNSAEWASLHEPLWHLLTTAINRSLPTQSALGEIPTEEKEKILTFGGSALLQGESTYAPPFLREIVDAAHDVDRLAYLGGLVSDIQRAMQNYYTEMRIEHAQDEYRIGFENLYVDRDVANTASGERFEADRLIIGSPAGSRIVVTGDPGVGKSTFVRHLINQVSHLDTPDDRVAPLLFLCRQYQPTREDTVLSLLARFLSVELSLEVSEKDLSALLSLGRTLVIFDGVDEIIDIPQRRAFIARIQAFGHRFPLATILATARRVGYKKASFSRPFQNYELAEFTQPQIADYVERWFQITRRTELEKSHFLRDLESISDISPNPLMLSLLCTLYRTRGYIPTNRRDVYRDCADLLFRRWDSMRQIETPFDHRQYGARLMQELALFYYRSAAAQRGVEERQLENVISRFFQDTSVVEPEAARQRAHDFLEFCADRAWLLTARGTSERNQRLFSFTHRTFNEYYAAEGLVRRANTVEEVVSEVVGAFESDPSSVLPDVIVQCAEEKFDNGAANIVDRLIGLSTGPLRRYRYLSLCLRLLNSSPIRQTVVDRVFAHLNDGLSAASQDAFTGDALGAILELYRDPRSRFERVALEGYNSPPAGTKTEWTLGENFVALWCRGFFLGQTALFEEDWNPIYRTIATSVSQKLLTSNNLAVTNLLIRDRLHTIEDHIQKFRSGGLFIHYINDYPYGGAVLGSYIRLVLQGNLTNEENDAALLSYVDRSIGSVRIYGEIGYDLRKLLIAAVSNSSRRTTNDRFPALSRWFCALLWEGSEKECVEEFLRPIFFGTETFDSFLRMAATRTSVSNVKRFEPTISRFSNSELDSLSSTYGSWSSSWCRGKKLLPQRIR
ncbi:NACHT domain-containing NTPase [Parafrankia sp. EUN1f]|uniref:NACHT domain-containing protein n=1 Tax=Parafrankia sp. EUN1f TaxID=102897 RepID=UPI0001C43DC3|nr:NACHT domain-containing protein [Parafrankia sp. EUN1f]EFC85950.1 putative signal transduction protein with Nacht domain [Parafrankia sp. EUN1f]